MSAQADNWKAKGNAALSSGNPQEAVDCYTKAIECDASNHVFFSNRSAAYLSMDDPRHALEDAQTCVKLNPTWAKGFARLGAANHALRQYEDAMTAYEQGLKVEPGNAACVNGLEEVQHAMRSTPAAMNPFANAFGPDMFAKIATNPRIAPLLQDPAFLQTLQDIQRNPANINAHLQDPRVMTVLGELLGLNLNMPSNAHDHGTGCQEPHCHDCDDDDDDERPETTRSSASNSSSCHPEAEKAPEPEPMDEEMTEEAKLKRVRQQEAEQLKAEGNQLYQQRQFDQAVAKYNEAIEKDGTNMSYYTNRAAVKLEQGQFDACIDDCKKAIEVGRENRAEYALVAKAYVRIANAYLKRGETQDTLAQAILHLENAQMENRTNEVDRKIKLLQTKLKKAKEKAYLDPVKAVEAKNQGNECFKTGDFPQAIDLYTEAIKRDPTNAVYYANRAAAYTKLTSFNEAKKDCEKALELDPQYVKAYSRMGAIQFFMKEFHKAKESYEKGLAIDATNQECQEGLRNVYMKIQAGGADEERAAHGLADPEIQAILRDPVMQQVLQDMQTDPRAAQHHLQNQVIATKIEKLIAAGVLQMK